MNDNRPKGEKFYTEGSPLKGHHVPPDWRRLDRPAKWRALVVNEIASTEEEARSMLGKHAAAVARMRRERAKRGGRYGG